MSEYKETQFGFETEGSRIIFTEKIGENRTHDEENYYFGAGPTGKRAYAFYREFCDVVAYADNNEAIQETDIGGVPVVSAEQIVNMAYDYIVIASVPGYDSICRQFGKLRCCSGKDKEVFIRCE